MPGGSQKLDFTISTDVHNRITNEYNIRTEIDACPSILGFGLAHQYWKNKNGNLNTFGPSIHMWFEWIEVSYSYNFHLQRNSNFEIGKNRFGINIDIASLIWQ